MTNHLLRLNVPAIDNDTNVGVVAVGSLGDVHEASLYWKKQQQQQQQETEEALLKKLAVHPLEPNRNFFEQAREQGHFASRQAQPGCFLYLVLPGNWLVGRLINDGKMCGAVYWHEDTIGNTAEHAARVIQQDICIDGKAGMYNLNEEPDEFLFKGGRIVGRMTWDDSGKRPLNRALDEASPLKLDEEILNEHLQSTHGPDFLFCDISHYLNQVWPVLKEKSGYGLEANDPPQARLWSVGEDGSACCARAFYEQQEYLAGRLLTTEVSHEMNGKPIKMPAVHMLVQFTYNSPEELEDASLENVLISGNSAFKTPLGFISFCLDKDTSYESLRKALGSVSSDKIMQLLEEGVVRNVETSAEDRVRVVDTVIPVLYSSRDAPLTSAPELVHLHNGILVYLMDFVLFEAFIMSLNKQGVLADLVAEVQSKCDAATDPYSKPKSPETLLALSPTVECAQVVLQAGVVPTLDSVSATMNRPLVFEIAWSKLQENTPANERSNMNNQLCIEAAKGLHSVVLSDILESLSVSKRQELVDANAIPILGPAEQWEAQAPPASKGTIGQVLLGNYCLQVFMERHTVEKQRIEHDTAAFHQTMTVLQNLLNLDSTSFHLHNDFWTELKYLARYERNPDELIGNLQERARQVVQSCGDVDIDLETRGRLQLELEAEKAVASTTDQEQTYHSPSVSRYWFTEAARKVNDTY